MLTNLGFLRQGQPWPPVCERARLSRYADNRRLFEGEHSEVYEKHLRRIQRELIGALACDALSHTNLSLAEIAEAIGFKYDTCFIKQFSAKIGESPTEYRQNSWR